MAVGGIARLGPLLLAVIIGRQLGPADYGAFTFATSLAMVAAQVAAMGWPTLMNRLVPKMRIDQDWKGLKGLHDVGDAFVFVASLAIGLALLAWSGFAGHLKTGFLIASMLVLPFAFAIMRRQQLATFRLPAAGLFFDQGFGAMLTVAVILVFGFSGLTATSVTFAVAILFGNMIATILMRKRMPPQVAGAARSVRLGEWMKIGSLLFVGSISRLLIGRVGELMLAPLAGLHESGLYGAAFRITFVVNFTQMVIMLVLTPLISEAFAEDKLERLPRIVRHSFLFALITYVPVAIVLIAFPGSILALLFGEEFRAAGPVLVLLILSQLLTSMAIPFQVMLTMGGKEEQYSSLLLGALGLQVLLNFVLIPAYGAIGAAAAMLASAVIVSILQIGFNWSLLKRH